MASRQRALARVIPALLALALACSPAPGLPKGIDPAKLQAVQAQVDFPLAVPRYLPLGLKLVNAEVLTLPAELPRVAGMTEVHMSLFAYPNGPGLQFSQSARWAGFQVQVQPPEAATPVNIGGTWGQLYQDPYREGRTYLSLLWQRDNITFELWGFLERGLTREEFLKIAESVR